MMGENRGMQYRMLGEDRGMQDRMMGENRGMQDRMMEENRGMQDRMMGENRGMQDRMMGENRGMQDWMMEENRGMQDRMMGENRGMQDRMMGENRGMQDRMTGENRGMQRNRMNPERMEGEMETMPNVNAMPQDMQPYFRMPGYEEILEEQRLTERDLRMLQSMFPEAAKLLLPYIEEECDKMEYEGSPMYDQYPDVTTIRRIIQRINDLVKDQFPPQPEPEQDDMLTMQYQGRRRNPPGRNWLEDMIQVMLLQEMHHRRCRHGRCRGPRPRPRRY